MTAVGKFATIAKSRLSKRIATNDDAAANEEEIEEQIEEDNVKENARENETAAPIPTMSNVEMAVTDDAVFMREEVQQQVEAKRVEKEAFENRISTASAERWTRSGRTYD
jgi:hypothetical protein